MHVVYLMIFFWSKEIPPPKIPFPMDVLHSFEKHHQPAIILHRKCFLFIIIQPYHSLLSRAVQPRDLRAKFHWHIHNRDCKPSRLFLVLLGRCIIVRKKKDLGLPESLFALESETLHSLAGFLLLRHSNNGGFLLSVLLILIASSL